MSNKSIIIWTYHRVLYENGPAAVTVDNFEKQIRWLRKKGFVFLDTRSLRDWFSGKLKKDSKYTMLTFDDGWADNLHWATPVLQKYNARAVLALNTSLVNEFESTSRGLDRAASSYQVINSKEALGKALRGTDKSSFLSWNELKKLRDTGIWDIQSHGNSHEACFQNLDNIRGFHPQKSHWSLDNALGEEVFVGAPRAELTSSLAAPATRLHPELRETLKNASNDSERLRICREFAEPLVHIESSEQFMERLIKDLTSCREIIFDMLGIESNAFFWPWGQFPDNAANIARECGFDMTFTTKKGIVNAKSYMGLLPRIAVPDSIQKFKKQQAVFSNPTFRAIRAIFN